MLLLLGGSYQKGRVTTCRVVTRGMIWETLLGRRISVVDSSTKPLTDQSWEEFIVKWQEISFKALSVIAASKQNLCVCSCFPPYLWSACHMLGVWIGWLFLNVCLWEFTILVGTIENQGSRMAEWLTRLPRFDPWQKTFRAAVLEVAQTVTNKLMKFIVTVYHSVYRMRH